MKPEPRYPRITPLKALDLLLDLESRSVDHTWAVARVKDALRNHVKADLARKRRAKRRKP